MDFDQWHKTYHLQLFLPMLHPRDAASAMPIAPMTSVTPIATLHTSQLWLLHWLMTPVWLPEEDLDLFWVHHPTELQLYGPFLPKLKYLQLLDGQAIPESLPRTWLPGCRMTITPEPSSDADIGLSTFATQWNLNTVLWVQIYSLRYSKLGCIPSFTFVFIVNHRGNCSQF